MHNAVVSGILESFWGFSACFWDVRDRFGIFQTVLVILPVFRGFEGYFGIFQAVSGFFRISWGFVKRVGKM